MRRRSGAACLTVLLALLATGAAPASGAVIIDYDSRYIYGNVHLYDYGPCPNDTASTCVNDSASDYFQQYPETSGAPFVAAGKAAAANEAGLVSASATQDSIAGPLTFGGTGTGNMGWTVNAGDYAYAHGLSYYYVGFRLTSSYAFEYNAAVSGVSPGTGGYHYGTGISYLYDPSGATYGDTYAYAVSHDATTQTDTAQDSGVLGPGTYYLYAYGQGYGYGDLTAEATGAFNVLLTLTPLETVPEPASLALLGLGLLGFAAARRRTI